MKKISILLLMILFLLIPNTVHADNQYEVRIDGGTQGKVDGQEQVVVNVAYYWEFNVNNYTVVPTDDKYYFKGFHLAGHSEIVDRMNITKDTVLVASYGVKADQVEYHVRYVDENDHSIDLLPMDVLYGNPGDKPVLAYKYVENYLPSNTMSYTGTLEEDTILEFVFEYRYMGAAAGTGVVTYDETYVYLEGEGTGTGGTTPGGSPVTPTPVDIIDIDDPEPPKTPDPVPTPTPPPPEPTPPEPTPTTIWQYLMAHPWIVAISGLTLSALIALILFLLRRRKQDEQ
jgi:hypothetical protein